MTSCRIIPIFLFGMDLSFFGQTLVDGEVSGVEGALGGGDGNLVDAGGVANAYRERVAVVGKGDAFPGVELADVDRRTSLGLGELEVEPASGILACEVVVDHACRFLRARLTGNDNDGVVTVSVAVAVAGIVSRHGEGRQCEG